LDTVASRPTFVALFHGAHSAFSFRADPKSGTADQIGRRQGLVGKSPGWPSMPLGKRLHDEREVVVQSFLPPSNQPDAHGITPRHEPVAVVLDLVNPIGAGRAGGRRGNARQGGMNAEGIA
jgi:hypothetical protein